MRYPSLRPANRPRLPSQNAKYRIEYTMPNTGIDGAGYGTLNAKLTIEEAPHTATHK